MRRLVASIIYLDFAIVFKLSGITDNEIILPNVFKTGWGRYFCDSFYRASFSKNQQKNTLPLMPPASPIRPASPVSTNQQGIEASLRNDALS